MGRAGRSASQTASAGAGAGAAEQPLSAAASQSPGLVLDGLLAALPQRVPLGAGQAQPAFAQGVLAQPAAPRSQPAVPELQFAAEAEELARRGRALLTADSTGTLDLPTAIRRAAAGGQAA